MSKDSMDVLVAGYQDLDAAQRDFDVLCGLVKDKRVRTGYGVILVAKDAGGHVTLADTGDQPLLARIPRLGTSPIRDDVAGTQRPVASPVHLARGACAGLRSSTWAGGDW
ncbi:MAG: hypothetical protein ACLP8X_06870 [Streptosporangiaceae bacterium]